MSWAREVMIMCDRCGAFVHGLGETTTVAQARAQLRKEGWTLTALREDVCPDCRGKKGLKRS